MRRGGGGDNDTPPTVVRARLAGSVHADAVLADVSGWTGRTLVAESDVVELLPGLLLGGPSREDDASVWLVLAAAGETADHRFHATPTSDSTTAALDLLGGLVQRWLDRRPATRGDCASGLPAYALALADGLARRHGGLVAVGDEPFRPPPPREPTRNVRVGSWPDPATITLAMTAPLPELVVDGAPEAGEPWPVAAWGECGVWVERLDDGLRPGDLGFADGGSPELLPLNARPGDAWIMHVEGPDDVATPAIDALLDHLAAALAAALDGVATDTEGFPITSR